MRIKIFDIFETPDKALVVGGTSNDFDNLSNDEIRNQIGSKIQLQNPDGSIVQTNVIEVELSSSLVGKKNVFLLLPSNLKRSSIQSGAIVCDI